MDLLSRVEKSSDEKDKKEAESDLTTLDYPSS
jgi:hypothetical protein